MGENFVAGVGYTADDGEILYVHKVPDPLIGIDPLYSLGSYEKFDILAFPNRKLAHCYLVNMRWAESQELDDLQNESERMLSPVPLPEGHDPENVIAEAEFPKCAMFFHGIYDNAPRRLPPDHTAEAGGLLEKALDEDGFVLTNCPTSEYDRDIALMVKEYPPRFVKDRPRIADFSEILRNREATLSKKHRESASIER